MHQSLDHAAERRAVAADGLLAAAGWAAGQIVFAGYEAHVPLAKRIAKGGALLALLLAIRLRWGRSPFRLTLAAMTAAIGALHGYWFHSRHGIHWRTAEPRDAYLRLIGHASAARD
ncbi:MAG TPA: hypothetical protein VGE07_31300 [Herpetosiphonaceae bacterium]